MHTCEDLDAVDPSAESGTIDSAALGREPVVFIERLRDDVGVGIGPIRPTTLGNLPAVEAEIDPSDGTCSRALLHENTLGLGALYEGTRAAGSEHAHRGSDG